MGDLPDINVWLALAVEEHPHHAIALPGLAAAWALYQRFRAIASVRLVGEPDDCDRHLAELVTAAAALPPLWTDAYLAALCQASGLRLVTFDADVRRFGLERCLVLSRD